MKEPKPDRIELGSAHWLEYFCWKPDRELNPQYDGIPDIERAGCIVGHLKPDGSECVSAIIFDTEETKALFHESQKWIVQSWEPLTVTPSLLCNRDKGGCGDHGFITAGRWVTA